MGGWRWWRLEARFAELFLVISHKETFTKSTLNRHHRHPATPRYVSVPRKAGRKLRTVIASRGATVNVLEIGASRATA
jgi:hypothetical protein